MVSASQNTQSTTAAGVDYRACIDVVTSYIHSHINGELQLEQLAGLAGFSPFHFHRVFAALMGETVAEYVRRVRLGTAVQRLLHSTEPVTKIALAVGYETPAAFTKAFRQRFGTTPTRLRTMDRARAFTLLLEQPTRQRGRQRKIQPEIRILPDQRVLYARSTGIKPALVMGDDPNVVPHDQCRFDAGVILREGVPIRPTKGVGLQVMPGGRWAVFQHKGPYETLWQTWNMADRDWLPRSGETLRDVPPVEIYLDDPRKTSPEKLCTEILIPIV